jgi:hypothetical protein
LLLWHIELPLRNGLLQFSDSESPGAYDADQTIGRLIAVDMARGIRRRWLVGIEPAEAKRADGSRVAARSI